MIIAVVKYTGDAVLKLNNNDAFKMVFIDCHHLRSQHNSANTCSGGSRGAGTTGTTDKTRACLYIFRVPEVETPVAPDEGKDKQNKHSKGNAGGGGNSADSFSGSGLVERGTEKKQDRITLERWRRTFLCVRWLTHWRPSCCRPLVLLGANVFRKRVLSWTDYQAPKKEKGKKEG